MLYDNGGRGAPLPMPKRPIPQQPQGPSLGLKDALAQRANQIRQSTGVGEAFKFPTYQTRQGNMAYAGQPQQMPPIPQLGFQNGAPAQMGQPQGVPTLKSRGRRPALSQLYARDINGRTPGMFGYIPPAAPAPRANMVPYGYQPPQYQGNPFMPAVLK